MTVSASRFLKFPVTVILPLTVSTFAPKASGILMEKSTVTLEFLGRSASTSREVHFFSQRISVSSTSLLSRP